MTTIRCRMKKEKCVTEPISCTHPRTHAHIHALTRHQETQREFVAAYEVFKDPGAIQRRKTKMKAIYDEYQCHPWRLGVNMVRTNIRVDVQICIYALHHGIPRFVWVFVSDFFDHVHMHEHTCINVYRCIFVYVYIYIYIYICTHD